MFEKVLQHERENENKQNENNHRFIRGKKRNQCDL